MNVYDAIMKAADQIEREPARFNFGSVDFPDCGSPGCALGWIGHYLGFTNAKNREILAVCSALGISAASHLDCAFYDRMDALCGNALQWRDRAKICANTLRLYAAKYHAPRRTDSELVADLMTRVTSGERIPEDA